MVLFPTPRRLEMMQGTFTLPPRGYIQILDSAEDLLPAARAIQRAMSEQSHRDYSLVVGGPDEDVVIDLLLSPHLPHQQAYEIEIEPRGIHVTASSAEGA